MVIVGTPWHPDGETILFPCITSRFRWRYANLVVNPKCVEKWDFYPFGVAIDPTEPRFASGGNHGVFWIESLW
jgi:hypothetical protein